MNLPRLAAIVLASALLASCANAPPKATGVEPVAGPAWREISIPGKVRTRYAAVHKEGQPAWHAKAERSASLLQRPVDSWPVRMVQFSWWVPSLIEQADLTRADQADSPARVVFGFDGDRATLPQRTRVLFDLAHSLTGDMPPYATLMYVWSNDAPVGSVISSVRSDRIRKIVVESGAHNLGRWRVYRRDLAADFKLAFGEDPGALKFVGIMTDADNTASHAEAWYGDIELR